MNKKILLVNVKVVSECKSIVNVETVFVYTYNSNLAQHLKRGVLRSFTQKQNVNMYIMKLP